MRVRRRGRVWTYGRSPVHNYVAFRAATGNQQAINGEVQRMVDEGYTPQEIMATVGQMLIDLGPLVSATCGVLER